VLREREAVEAVWQREELGRGLVGPKALYCCQSAGDTLVFVLSPLFATTTTTTASTTVAGDERTWATGQAVTMLCVLAGADGVCCAAGGDVGALRGKEGGLPRVFAPHEGAASAQVHRQS